MVRIGSVVLMISSTDKYIISGGVSDDTESLQNYRAPGSNKDTVLPKNV